MESNHEHEWDFQSYDQCSEWYQCLCGATKTITTIIEEPEDEENE